MIKANEETFGERVLRLRKQLGLSQTQLAKKIGASHGSIQNYEANSLPKGEYAIKLAEVFKCSIDYLLTGKSTSEPREENDKPARYLKLESIDQIIAEHHDLIDEFKDKATGKEFNSILLKLERRSAKEYYSLLGYAKRVLAELEGEGEPDDDPDPSKKDFRYREAEKKMS